MQDLLEDCFYSNPQVTALNVNHLEQLKLQYNPFQMDMSYYSLVYDDIHDYSMIEDSIRNSLSFSSKNSLLDFIRKIYWYVEISLIKSLFATKTSLVTIKKYLLLDAMKKNNLDKMQYLLENSTIRNPLNFYYKNSLLDTTRKIYWYIQTCFYTKEDLLFDAIKKDNLNKMQYLLENGAKVNTKNEKIGETPLHITKVQKSHKLY